jgi:hypothetical protein
MHIKIIIIIILLVIIFLLYKKQRENFSTEAIDTLVSLYTDNTRTVNLNNLDISGNLNVKGDISGTTIYGKNVKVSNNLDVSGNLNVTGNISGNINTNYVKARYIQVGNDIKIDIDRKDDWTISEVVVIDDKGKNVAFNKTPTILKGTAKNSTTFPLSAVVDEVIYDTYYHGDTGVNLIEIDLGEEYNIVQISLWARGGTNSLSITNRLDGTHVTLLDKNQNELRTYHTGSWENTYNKIIYL